jgi:uncharacterized cofD-like protein
VYVCNIMTEAGETDGFSVRDHVSALERHLGRVPDVVVVNDRPVSASLREAYAAEGAEVVRDDADGLVEQGVDVARLPLLDDGPFAQHDSRKLAQWLVRRRADHRGRAAA